MSSAHLVALETELNDSEFAKEICIKGPINYFFVLVCFVFPHITPPGRVPLWNTQLEEMVWRQVQKVTRWGSVVFQSKHGQWGRQESTIDLHSSQELGHPPCQASLSL